MKRFNLYLRVSCGWTAPYALSMSARQAAVQGCVRYPTVNRPAWT
jgi:hypothetical protein